MTLAVGCKIPWTTPGTLANRQPNEVVFLLADTRWTFLSPPRQKDDEGRKLFRLHKQLAAVYAGDVPAAEQAIHELARRFKKFPDTPSDVVEAAASDCFARTFQQVGRADVGLWSLVGGREADGRAFLIYLGHESGSVPISLDGHPYAIGPKETCQEYLNDLRDYERRRTNDGDPLRNAEDWLTACYAALDQLIQSRRDHRVGGKIQTGIISESGFWEREYAVLDEVATPPARDKWRRPTSKLKELKKYCP